jgi:hypothetical protein
MEKKRVKIIKCTWSTYWYNDKIGEEFDVEYETVRDYYVGTNKFETHYSRGILKADAEEIRE